MGIFFHSVTLDESKCVGCTNCIKRCPTEAIRVRSGKAVIMSERSHKCHQRYALTVSVIVCVLLHGLLVPFQSQHGPV